MASGRLRTHTNQFVYRRTAEEINRGRSYGVRWKTIEKLSDFYELQRRTLIADIIIADDRDPVREITLDPGSLTQVDYGIRRVGGKRNNWWEKGISGYWDVIKKTLIPHFRYAAWDDTNFAHIQLMQEAAGQGIGTRREAGRRP